MLQSILEGLAMGATAFAIGFWVIDFAVRRTDPSRRKPPR
jgi:hypothetical protein